MGHFDLSVLVGRHQIGGAERLGHRREVGGVGGHEGVSVREETPDIVSQDRPVTIRVDGDHGDVDTGWIVGAAERDAEVGERGRAVVGAVGVTEVDHQQASRARPEVEFGTCRCVGERQRRHVWCRLPHEAGELALGAGGARRHRDGQREDR